MDRLNANGVLQVDQQLESQDSTYKLIMQGDGNLVLYRKSDGKALWATGTNGKGAMRAIMQSDGNLVLYTSANAAVWASNTVGNPGSFLQLQTDGNLVIYKGTTPLWDTQTDETRLLAKLNPNEELRVGQERISTDSRFRLVMQADGNLVVYRVSDGIALWATATDGKGAVRAVMQSDGNLVLYTAGNVAVWASNTVGNAGAFLQLKNDSNLVIYKGTTKVWATGINNPVRGTSNNVVPGVLGENTAGGAGVFGTSKEGAGVFAVSEAAEAVHAESKSPGTAAAVAGITLNPNGSGPGIYGESRGNGADGVYGVCKAGNGVHGESDAGEGVYGHSKTGSGVHGESDAGFGVYGKSQNQSGVLGESQNFVGVWADTKASNHPALFARGAPTAARFEGDVEVTGDIRLVNADCAEDFDVAENVEPGTVMVLGSEGSLLPSHQAYDKKVAGVISGAGNYKPGIVLDRQQSSNTRVPVALMGKVYCKVDAQYASIEVGDLLTTSPTTGHAMKAEDALKAFGAVIGKALHGLETGRGLIPILVALQ